MDDDAVVAETLDDGLLGAVEVDPAADDAEDAFHLFISGRRDVGIHKRDRFRDGFGERQAYLFPPFRIEVCAGESEGRTVLGVRYGSIVAHVVQGFSNQLDSCFGVFRELDAELGAGVSLVHQVRAALQVQSQLETQRACFCTVNTWETGNSDMNFRQRQGDDRDSQHHQYESCQENGASSHSM